MYKELLAKYQEDNQNSSATQFIKKMKELLPKYSAIQTIKKMKGIAEKIIKEETQGIPDNRKNMTLDRLTLQITTNLKMIEETEKEILALKRSLLEYGEDNQARFEVLSETNLSASQHRGSTKGDILSAENDIEKTQDRIQFLTENLNRLKSETKEFRKEKTKLA